MRVCSRARSTRALLPRLAILAGSIVIAANADAGVYSVDDTGTASGLEIKAKVYSTRSRDQQAWRLPELGVSGPLAANMEWGVSGGYGRVGAHRRAATSGWRDLSASIKWRFLDPTSEDAVSMTIEPELSLPTGSASSGVGRGAAAFELPLRVSKPFGRVVVTGQISAEHIFGRDDDSASVGALLEYAASEQWSFGFEVVADAACRHLRAYTLRGDAGLKWKTGVHFQFEMLGGRSFDTRSGDPVTVFRVELKYLP